MMDYKLEGMGIDRKGDWFVVQFPNGILDDQIFRSRFRAAEKAMEMEKVDYWPRLFKKGFRVIGLKNSEVEGE